MSNSSLHSRETQDWPSPKLCRHRITKVTGVGKFCWQCGICLESRAWHGREITGKLPQVPLLIDNV